MVTAIPYACRLSAIGSRFSFLCCFVNHSTPTAVRVILRGRSNQRRAFRAHRCCALLDSVEQNFMSDRMYPNRVLEDEDFH